MKDNVKLADL